MQTYKETEEALFNMNHIVIDTTKVAKETLISYITNQENSLESRWSLYCTFGESLLPVLKFLPKELYNDNSFSALFLKKIHKNLVRFEVALYVDSLFHLDIVEDSEDGIAYKEFVLQTGTFGFTNDW